MRAKLNADGVTMNWVIRSGNYEIGVYKGVDGKLKANVHRGDDLLSTTGGPMVENLARSQELRTPEGRLVVPRKGDKLHPVDFIKLATVGVPA